MCPNDHRDATSLYLDPVGQQLPSFMVVDNSGLSYVVRDVAVPACVVDEPHSEEYGPIKGYQTHRLSHTHALFKVNNAEVFNIT